MSSYFQTSLRDRKLELIFEDRTTRNSFSLAAARELVSLLEKYETQFDVLSFFAKGRVFCSGGNLADYGQMAEAEEGHRVNRSITEALEKLALLPVPTFCYVEGDVFGGGVELLSSFDFVYSVPHAFFALWQRRIGLTFGWGGGARLEKRLGHKTLVQLSLTTQTVSAVEALSIGLIDGVFLPGQGAQTFEREWRRVSQLPLAPVSALKRWLSRSEREAFEALWWNEEHRKVLSNFKSK